MWFPKREDVLEMHGETMAASGERGAVLNASAIDAALARAAWGPFEGASDLPARAAVLMRGLVQDHPFVDGNKRTAFVATDAFLEENGMLLEAAPEDAVAFMLAVARADIDVTGIEAWIRGHVRKL